MKKFLLLITSIGLFSCTAVKFETPQPADAAELKEFPSSMLGTFTSDDKDTLKIMESSFRFWDGEDIDLTAELSTSDAVLKRHRKTYILSLKDDDSWEVFPLKISKNKITVLYIDLDSETQELLDQMDPASVMERRTEDGKIEYYLINPSAKEFQELLKKNLFSEKVEFKRIR